MVRAEFDVDVLHRIRGSVIVATLRRQLGDGRPQWCTVTRAGSRPELSPKEFAVLEYLLAGHGRVISAEEPLEWVWGEAADTITTAGGTFTSTYNLLAQVTAKNDPDGVAHVPIIRRMRWATCCRAVRAPSLSSMSIR